MNFLLIASLGKSKVQLLPSVNIKTRVHWLSSESILDEKNLEFL